MWREMGIACATCIHVPKGRAKPARLVVGEVVGEERCLIVVHLCFTWYVPPEQSPTENKNKRRRTDSGTYTQQARANLGFFLFPHLRARSGLTRVREIIHLRLFLR